MKRGIKTGSKILLALLFILAGINHFRIPDFYLNLMPDYIPYHTFMVYLSGVTEIVAGTMLLIPRFSKWGAWFIVAHLVVFLTVHFWMIQHAEDRYADIPLAMLWFPIVLQAIFITWALWYVSDDGPYEASPEHA